MAPLTLRIDTGIIESFVGRHSLPQRFKSMADAYYVPVARWIARRARRGECYLFGINGGQGTGKSTLAAFLRLVLQENGLNVVALSIDDFYLTRSERDVLARVVHPLLSTRGVPGTHDVGLLASCLSALKSATSDTILRLPQFSKEDDERSDTDLTVKGPVDVVLLEGWCIATPPQPKKALKDPINALERDHDVDGRWRRWVNDQLREHYVDIFAQLDAILYLQAPSFTAVHRWRVDQERKLREKAGRSGDRLMSERQLKAFVEHFERLTRVALETLPKTADIVLRLDEEHMCVGAHYRDETDA